MNDLSRSFLGVLGTATGITLADAATGAALAASVATAAFMTVSFLEKVRALRAAKRAEAQARFPFAER